MKRRKQYTRRKLVHLIGSIFAIAVFIIPAYATAKWLVGVYDSKDNRKVSTFTPFQVRQVDNKSQPITPFKEPIVSVTFDDGWESVYTNAIPLLQRYGFHTTQYIIAGVLGNQVYMSEAQLASMQANGTEIGAHTLTHKDLTTLTDEELTVELSKSKDILTKDFGSSTDFTSPLGAYNAHTLSAIKQYYRSHKNDEGDPDASFVQQVNTGSSFSPYTIKSYSVRSTTTLDDISKLIKDAQTSNGWLVLTYHQVDQSHEVFSVTPAMFQSQLELLSKSNLRSATIAQVLDQIDLQKQATK